MLSQPAPHSNKQVAALEHLIASRSETVTVTCHDGSICSVVVQCIALEADGPERFLSAWRDQDNAVALTCELSASERAALTQESREELYRTTLRVNFERCVRSFRAKRPWRYVMWIRSTEMSLKGFADFIVDYAR